MNATQSLAALHATPQKCSFAEYIFPYDFAVSGRNAGTASQIWNTFLQDRRCNKIIPVGGNRASPETPRRVDKRGLQRIHPHPTSGPDGVHGEDVCQLKADAARSRSASDDREAGIHDAEVEAEPQNLGLWWTRKFNRVDGCGGRDTAVDKERGRGSLWCKGAEETFVVQGCGRHASRGEGRGGVVGPDLRVI